jgi:hypothetical protein
MPITLSATRSSTFCGWTLAVLVELEGDVER